MKIKAETESEKDYDVNKELMGFITSKIRKYGLDGDKYG